MDEECYPVEDLAEIYALPAGDPRRGHLSRCPRCRARLAEYRSFMTAPAPAGADVHDAERHLAACLREAQRAGERSPMGGWTWSWRPALGMAAALVGVVGIWLGVETLRPRPVREGPPPERVLRGEPPGDANTVVLQPVSARPDGRLQLSWSAVAGADGYTVVFYAADLTKVSRADAAAETTLAVDAPPAADSPSVRQPRLWCVIARSQGDKIARSSLAPLEPTP